MDRKYKRAESVNVYATQSDKDAGRVLRNIKRVPYSSCGFDSYEYEGRIFPGYIDPKYPDADACIILDKGA